MCVLKNFYTYTCLKTSMTARSISEQKKVFKAKRKAQTVSNVENFSRWCLDHWITLRFYTFKLQWSFKKAVFFSKILSTFILWACVCVFSDLAFKMHFFLTLKLVLEPTFAVDKSKCYHLRKINVKINKHKLYDK